MSFTNLMKKLLATLMFWKKQIPPKPVAPPIIPVPTVDERRAKFQQQILEVQCKPKLSYASQKAQERLAASRSREALCRNDSLASIQVDNEPTIYMKPHEYVYSIDLKDPPTPTCESDHEHRRSSPVSSPSHSSYDSPSHSHSSYSSCSGSSHSSSDSSCSSSSSSSCGD